jgi:hypothetical protein
VEEVLTCPACRVLPTAEGAAARTLIATLVGTLGSCTWPEATKPTPPESVWRRCTSMPQPFYRPAAVGPEPTYQDEMVGIEPAQPLDSALSEGGPARVTTPTGLNAVSVTRAGRRSILEADLIRNESVLRSKYRLDHRVLPW